MLINDFSNCIVAHLFWLEHLVEVLIILRMAIFEVVLHSRGFHFHASLLLHLHLLVGLPLQELKLPELVLYDLIKLPQFLQVSSKLQLCLTFDFWIHRLVIAVVLLLCECLGWQQRFDFFRLLFKVIEVYVWPCCLFYIRRANRRPPWLLGRHSLGDHVCDLPYIHKTLMRSLLLNLCSHAFAVAIRAFLSHLLPFLFIGSLDLIDTFFPLLCIHLFPLLCLTQCVFGEFASLHVLNHPRADQVHRGKDIRWFQLVGFLLESDHRWCLQTFRRGEQLDTSTRNLRVLLLILGENVGRLLHHSL